MKIVATTLFASSLPPERYRPNDDRWNPARPLQKLPWTFGPYRMSNGLDIAKTEFPVGGVG